MRQTFADEIINAGYDLHPETVVITLKSEYLSPNDLASEFTQCQPIFDFCFVQITSMGKIASGAFIGKFNDPNRFFVQMFMKRDYSDLIGYFSTPLYLTFEDGMIAKTEDSPVDFSPPGDLFSPIGFPSDFDGDGRKIVLGATMYAFYLMHQRAEVELITPSRQVSRQVKRKTGKKPSPHFEIKVSPQKTQKRYIKSGKSRQKRDAHIVRGHFATYTDNNPLFGKYTGTYWRPSHARGIKEGDKPSPKNYRIVMPEENVPSQK